jgi:signal transduction histidine kinase
MNSVLAHVHREDRDEVRAMIDKAGQDHQPHQMDFRIVRKGDETRFVSWQGEHVLDIQGNPTTVVGTIQDITDRKLTEKMMTEARDRALEASRLKSEFLANMSHEFRTPMTGILGLIDILRSTDLTGEQREYVDTLERCGGALLARVNDVLEFSKSEAGKLEPQVKDFELETVLVDVTEAISPLAEKKNLRMVRRDDFSPEFAGKELLQGDPDRLRQVLLNLLGNAVKFTENGEVTLHTEVAYETEDALRLRFQVHDTGIGIPPEKLGNVFEAFTQVDGSTTRQFGGTGLGLAICRGLVEMMEGEIGVDSTVGMGSTFWFEVGLRKVHGKADALPSETRGDAA